jgi:RNA polymerase sigma factor (sigma-70 family)
MTTTKQFDSLDSYISLAKKTISKFAPKFYNGLSKEMLMNEEAISDVATAIMYADWRYDETRVGKTGMKKTKYSYRNQCAIWAIKTYITNKYKSSTKVQSIFAMKDDEEISLDVEDSKQQQPIDILMDNEYKTILQNNLEEMLNNELLSEKQKEQIKMYYYDDMTLSEIGKQFNISREAVRQNIKRGISIIQTYDTV